MRFWLIAALFTGVLAFFAVSAWLHRNPVFMCRRELTPTGFRECMVTADEGPWTYVFRKEEAVCVDGPEGFKCFPTPEECQKYSSGKGLCVRTLATELPPP